MPPPHLQAAAPSKGPQHPYPCVHCCFPTCPVLQPRPVTLPQRSAHLPTPRPLFQPFQPPGVPFPTPSAQIPFIFLGWAQVPLPSWRPPVCFIPIRSQAPAPASTFRRLLACPSLRLLASMCLALQHVEGRVVSWPPASLARYPQGLTHSRCAGSSLGPRLGWGCSSTNHPFPQQSWVSWPPAALVPAPFLTAARAP